MNREISLKTLIIFFVVFNTLLISISFARSALQGGAQELGTVYQG